jgi:hypothetical protein
MKLASAAFVIALLGATAAAGQTLGQPLQSYGAGASGGGYFHIGGPQDNGANIPSTGQPRTFTLCPASMHAQHLAGGNVVKTRGTHQNSQNAGPGQWLHLTLIPRDAKPIVKATMTIRGYSSKGRLAGAESTHSEDFDVVRTITVSFTGNKDGTASSDFLVPGMTAVARIDLTSLAYADGATQSIAPDDSCRVIPDPFMLISSR